MALRLLALGLLVPGYPGGARPAALEAARMTAEIRPFPQALDISARPDPDELAEGGGARGPVLRTPRRVD